MKISLIRLFSKTHETNDSVLGNDNEITHISVNKLIELYEAWDKPEQAQQWRAKLQGKSQKSISQSR
ncbi:MAG: hypothetical protein ACYS80_02170 [Planctomycetota bacterium]|jgi:hypothetical protein